MTASPSGPRARGVGEDHGLAIEGAGGASREADAGLLLFRVFVGLALEALQVITDALMEAGPQVSQVQEHLREQVVAVGFDLHRLPPVWEPQHGPERVAAG